MKRILFSVLVIVSLIGGLSYNLMADSKTGKRLYYANLLEKQYLKMGFEINILAGERRIFFKCDKNKKPKVLAYQLYLTWQKDRAGRRMWKSLDATELVFVWGSTLWGDYYSFKL